MYISSLAVYDQVCEDILLTCALCRGLSALKEVGLDEHVRTDYGIPMYARLIHNRVSFEDVTCSKRTGKWDVPKRTVPGQVFWDSESLKFNVLNCALKKLSQDISIKINIYTWLKIFGTQYPGTFSPWAILC